MFIASSEKIRESKAHSPSRTTGLLADTQDLHGLRADQQAVEVFHAEKAHLVLFDVLFIQRTDGQRHAVDDVIVGEITKRHRFAVRGHELGDVDRLAEDCVAVLVPEILAVPVLQRFQFQCRFVVHEPHAVATELLIH